MNKKLTVHFDNEAAIHKLREQCPGRTSLSGHNEVFAVLTGMPDYRRGYSEMDNAFTEMGYIDGTISFKSEQNYFAIKFISQKNH